MVPSPSKTRMKRVTATDGTGDALRGICVFFLRPNTTKPVTVANVSEELMCGQLDTSDGRSILEVIQEYLSEVMVPALKQGQNWGSLQPLQIESFMNTLRNYINFIKGALNRHVHNINYIYIYTFCCRNYIIVLTLLL